MCDFSAEIYRLVSRYGATEHVQQTVHTGGENLRLVAISGLDFITVVVLYLDNESISARCYL